MVVGQDVAAVAHDHAAAYARGGLFAIRIGCAMKKAVPGGSQLGSAPAPLAGVDAHHRLRCQVRRCAKTAHGHLVRWGGGGLQQSHRPAAARCQPGGLESQNNKISRQNHRGGLGKQQPKTLHRKLYPRGPQCAAAEIVGGAPRAHRPIMQRPVILIFQLYKAGLRHTP